MIPLGGKDMKCESEPDARASFEYINEIGQTFMVSVKEKK
jgi:hypothetical protein